MTDVNDIGLNPDSRKDIGPIRIGIINAQHHWEMENVSRHDRLNTIVSLGAKT